MIEVTLLMLPGGMVLADISKEGPACPLCADGIIDAVSTNPYVLEGVIGYGKCDNCGRYFRAANTPQEQSVTHLPLFTDDELATFIERDIPGVEHYAEPDAEPTVEPKPGDSPAGPFPS